MSPSVAYPAGRAANSYPSNGAAFQPNGGQDAYTGYYQPVQDNPPAAAEPPAGTPQPYRSAPPTAPSHTLSTSREASSAAYGAYAAQQAYPPAEAPAAPSAPGTGAWGAAGSSGAGYSGSGHAGTGYADPGHADRGYSRSGYSGSAAGGLGHTAPGRTGEPGGPAGRSAGVTPPSRPRGGAAAAGPGGSGDGLPHRGRHATGWDSGFDRVVGWTLLGSLLPGAGLVAAGRKVLGWFVLGSCLLVGLAALGLVALGDPIKFVTQQVLAHPERLSYAAVVIVVLGLLWAGHVVLTNLSLRRFAELTGAQSALSWLLVTTLAAGGVGAAAMTGDQVRLGRDTLSSILAGDDGSLSSAAQRPNAAQADPWKNTPRINVLLMGSDAGADRKGIRPDTIIVASIDTKSGETVLFSLPRNLEHVPFPDGTQQAIDYPDGYYCEDHQCLLNALWQFGVENKDKYYPGEKNPGLAATVQGVQEVLGLTIDNYAMLDLRGFMQFVDAIGGVTINVERRIPVGGHKDPETGQEVGVTSYIKAGKRQLNGYQALWYARSRSDSDDFERMKRQRCVIGALADQADPQTLALNLPGIMKAAKNNIRTNIRITDVDAWVTLALRVQKAHVRSLPFTNAVIASGDPDFERMRELVQDALTEPVPVATATASPTPSAKSSASPSGKATTKKPTPSAAPVDPEKAVDVKSVC